MSNTNDIPTTVDQAMQTRGLRQYRGQAQPVVDSLVQREKDIASSLVDSAVNAGMSREDALSLLSEVGMHLDTPDTTAAAGDDSTPPAWAQGLIDFARQHGYRG